MSKFTLVVLGIALLLLGLLIPELPEVVSGGPIFVHKGYSVAHLLGDVMKIAGIVCIIIGVVKKGQTNVVTENKEVLRKEALKREQAALDGISNTGELPVLKIENLPKCLRLILKKDEALYLWRDTVTLYQKKS